MSVGWMLGLFALVAISLLAAELCAYTAKLRISEVAPDYAQQLFRTWGQRILPKSGPCRFKVLYFQPPLPRLAATVKKLRVVLLTSDILLYAYIGVAAIWIVHGWLG
ncbi:hypothetical protein [Lysobacter sp. cf310]|uniref:hypothetical protein n=1 Tax=Lysobacter sp. cf310 TaxID=1761790 RepID=UPI0008EA11CC|nr:hypothetical protein [Lysobacter sp. cf310]SFK46435.1 hypothetical protein SAMN04487938_0925 [Lysobacter sp. cf310]